MAHKHLPEPMPYTKARHLLNPLRGLILPPKKLVHRLGLRPDAMVLELGPGPGYFSPAVARAIPDGTLLLVDVQQEMLDMARERLDKAGMDNVAYRKGDATSLPVESDSMDVAFLVAMLGEVPDRRTCLRELHRVLKTDGLLSITEITLGDPHAIAKADLLQLVESEGFSLLARHGGLFHYTVNFAKVP